MQFLSTLILGLAAVVFASPMPVEGVDTGILAKRCIAPGGTCIPSKPDCCQNDCRQASDGSFFCAECKPLLFILDFRP